ncbi:unnamed protein product [Phytomonas sp. Hart1]|nr:unnamed protein product [Phytomonas sp. Hart1]|eukprot:CCW69677.1 unnamed protein product [Phytomonas sp. isolate Hart1]
MLANLLRRLRGDPVGVPGVIYSDQIEIDMELEQHRSVHWLGELRNVRMETVPHQLVEADAAQQHTIPGPEDQPYTFWERLGLVPVHPSRVRARQHYHPITDFALYDYDEISPEEKELTARWIVRVMTFNTAVPAGILAAAGCLFLPFHTVYRMPLLVASAVTGVGVEITRSYMSALKERQDLDDFILAKEIWYIKNVETYHLGIPRIPRGREDEYQSYLDSSKLSQTRELPQELLDSLHF